MLRKSTWAGKGMAEELNHSIVLFLVLTQNCHARNQHKLLFSTAVGSDSKGFLHGLLTASRQLGRVKSELAKEDRMLLHG